MTWLKKIWYKLRFSRDTAKSDIIACLLEVGGRVRSRSSSASGRHLTKPLWWTNIKIKPQSILVLILIYGQLIVIWSASATFVFISDFLIHYYSHYSWLFEYPLWEWGQFFSIIVWIIGTPFFLKDNYNNSIFFRK